MIKNTLSILFVTSLIALLAWLAVGQLEAATVEPYTEKCVEQFDDYNSMYDDMLTGINLLAKNIDNPSVTLQPCIYALEKSEPYRVISMNDTDSVIFIVTNSYYEPDGPEVCNMIHDEIIDILWQAGYIEQSAHEKDYCTSDYTIFLPIIANEQSTYNR